MLTKPREERLEQEPDWVKQVKKTTGELRPIPEQQPPVGEEVVTAPETVSQMEAQPPVEEEAVVEPEPVSAPTASIEELGRAKRNRMTRSHGWKRLPPNKARPRSLPGRNDWKKSPNGSGRRRNSRKRSLRQPWRRLLNLSPAADLSDVEGECAVMA
ncbi:MAG: hypothetical protein MZV70_17770 [Desulfobacterales bacterium]|nr:hypothetical protein [Desulfobacterales bacterium]